MKCKKIHSALSTPLCEVLILLQNVHRFWEFPKIKLTLHSAPYTKEIKHHAGILWLKVSYHLGNRLPKIFLAIACTVLKKFHQHTCGTKYMDIYVPFAGRRHEKSDFA